MNRSTRNAGLVAAVVVGLVSVWALAQPVQTQGRGFPPPGGFFGGGPGTGLRALVARFDRDGNGRLDVAERRAARQVAGGGGGFGPGGGFGLAAPAGDPPQGPRLTPGDVPSGGSAPLYDLGVLRTVFLRFENPDWERELADFYGTDVEVPAVVTVDGKTYSDVGVHFRGQSSFRMVPEGRKRSLNLSFDFVDDNQRLLGYRTLNLLNVNGDPTFVRPVLYAEVSRRFGPTPRANYARVVINGEFWGVYINAQQFNSDFTREWFMSARGVRWRVPGSPGGRGGLEYLGEELDPYRRLYELKTRENPAAWADLVQLCRTLNQTPVDKLEAALAPILDIDGALKFLAVEVVLVNSDGYWTRASDYSIYEDEARRFHIVPHDMNEGLAAEGGRRGFGGFPGGGGGRGGELDPLVAVDDVTKPLRSKLLAVPALRARYLAYVREIADRWLDWNTVGPMVRDYQALIAADVKAETHWLYTFDAFQSGVASLRTFFDRRRAFLLGSPQ